MPCAFSPEISGSMQGTREENSHNLFKNSAVQDRDHLLTTSLWQQFRRLFGRDGSEELVPSFHNEMCATVFYHKVKSGRRNILTIHEVST